MKAGRGIYDCGDTSSHNSTVGEVKELIQESHKGGSCEIKLVAFSLGKRN